MIANALITVLFLVFDLLTSVILIPGFPDSVKELLAITLDYCSSGVCILAQFIDMNFLLMLFSLVIIVGGGINAYKFIMWVLRKIPGLSIR